MIQILGFGGSVLQGVGSTNGGWFDLLKRDLYKKMFGKDGIGEKYGVFNLGVLANSSEKVLARIKVETDNRNWRDSQFVFIYSAGMNDSKAVNDPDNFVSSVEEYTKNLKATIDLMRQYSNKIIFVGFNPFDEVKVRNKGMGSFFWLERSKLFDAAMEQVCQEVNVTFVPIFNEMLKLQWKNMLAPDGLHPNDVGHEWIAEQVKPVLKTMLEDKHD